MSVYITAWKNVRVFYFPYTALLPLLTQICHFRPPDLNSSGLEPILRGISSLFMSCGKSDMSCRKDVRSKFGANVLGKKMNLLVYPAESKMFHGKTSNSDGRCVSRCMVDALRFICLWSSVCLSVCLSLPNPHQVPA